MTSSVADGVTPCAGTAGVLGLAGAGASSVATGAGGGVGSSTGVRCARHHSTVIAAAAREPSGGEPRCARRPPRERAPPGGALALGDLGGRELCLHARPQLGGRIDRRQRAQAIAQRRLVASRPAGRPRTSRRWPRTALPRSPSSSPSRYAVSRCGSSVAAQTRSSRTPGPEQLAHLRARLVQLRLAGPHPALEDRRALLVRQALDVVEHEDRAVARRELPERCLDARGERRSRAPWLGRRGNLGQRFVADLLAAAAPREVRERRVDREPVDPGRQRRVAAEVRERRGTRGRTPPARPPRRRWRRRSGGPCRTRGACTGDRASPSRAPRRGGRRRSAGRHRRASRAPAAAGLGERWRWQDGCRFGPYRSRGPLTTCRQRRVLRRTTVQAVTRCPERGGDTTAAHATTQTAGCRRCFRAGMCAEL